MSDEIDVIIPCYNGEAYIFRAITSVLNQTHGAFEILVIDDGSTDSSGSIIKNLMSKYPQLKYLRQENQGLSSARNFGLKNSHSKFVAFMDVDDFWLPQKLSRQFDFLIKNETCPAVASGYSTTFDGDLLSPGHYPTRIINATNLLNRKSFVPGSASSLMVNKYLTLGQIMFDEELTFAEDLDFAIAVARFGEIGIIRSPDVVITLSPTSMQATLLNDPTPAVRSFLEIIEKHQDLSTSLKRFFLRIDVFWQIFWKGLKSGRPGILKEINLRSLHYESHLSIYQLRILLLLAPIIGFPRKGVSKISDFFNY